MGPPSGSHRQYVMTLVAPGAGAGAGVPGAAVRDALTGRTVGRVPGPPEEMYSAVAGTGDNRLFFLTVRSSPARAATRDPGTSQVPAGAVAARIDDAGLVLELSAVPGFAEPAGYGPGLAATADGTRLAFPVPRQHRKPPSPGEAGAEISIVTVATGERTVWRAGSDGLIRNVSISADGRRLVFSWHGAEGSGIRLADLPDGEPGGVLTTPSRLVVPVQNSLGNLGQAVISPDGSKVYVTAARYGSGGLPVTRLAEVSAEDGQLLRIAYERQGADPGNVIFGWGPLVIDPGGQHVLIAYSGNLGRIDLRTGLADRDAHAGERGL